MYFVTIEHVFSAAHALTIAGEPEPLHGHDFRVTAEISSVRGGDPDAALEDGMLVDFHAAHRELVKLCEPYHNANLNETPPFDRVNPSAELIARRLSDGLAVALDPLLRSPDGTRRARVRRVTVTESPGCSATYKRP